MKEKVEIPEQFMGNIKKTKSNLQDLSEDAQNNIGIREISRLEGIAFALPELALFLPKEKIKNYKEVKKNIDAEHGDDIPSPLYDFIYDPTFWVHNKPHQESKIAGNYCHTLHFPKYNSINLVSLQDHILIENLFEENSEQKYDYSVTHKDELNGYDEGRNIQTKYFTLPSLKENSIDFLKESYSQGNLKFLVKGDDVLFNNNDEIYSTEKFCNPPVFRLDLGKKLGGTNYESFIAFSYGGINLMKEFTPTHKILHHK